MVRALGGRGEGCVILLVAMLRAEEPEVVVDPVDIKLEVEANAQDLSWCQDERALFTWDGRWCDAVPPDCPGMTARCAQTPGDSWWDQLMERLAAWRHPEEEAPPMELSLPDPRQAIVVLFIALVAVALGWVVVSLRGRRRPAGSDPEAMTSGPAQPPETIEPPTPLAGADAAARAGRFEEALMLLRGLAIDALVRRGVVRADPSHTDREVDAWMQGRPEREPWRVVMLAVERVRYARRPGDPRQFAQAREATMRLLAMLLLLLWAAPAHAGPTSHDLLVEVADEVGFRDLGSGADAVPGTMVVLPDGLFVVDDAADLVEAVRAGAVLLVVTPPDLDRGDLQPFLPTERIPEAEVHATGWYSDPDGAPIQAPLVVVGEVWEVPTTPESRVLAQAGARPVAVATPLGAGEVIVVGAPTLFDDASLLHAANFTFARALLDRSAPLAIVTPLEDQRPSAVATFQRAGLGPFLLHGLVLVIVAAWWRGRPFAAPVDPVAVRRRDFTAHVQAVGRLNRRAKAVRRASAALSAWTLHRLRARLRLDGASLVSVIAARTGLPEATVAATLTDAERCAADPDGVANPDELPLLETLWQISTRTLPSRTSPPLPNVSDASKRPSTGS